MTIKELHDIIAPFVQRGGDMKVVVWEPDPHGVTYPIAGGTVVMDPNTEELTLELRTPWR